jgi:rhodanese-related sulfurtransferase
MNRKKSFIAILVVILMMTGCAASSYDKISAQQGREMLLNDSSVILLDVRTLQEYQEVRIPNALLIPLDTLRAMAGEKLADKDAKIIIYCRSGNRSKQAADILIELGYTNVYDMGGIIDWPYETEAGQ